jgi:RimJ/RimL family protein N-acetyltransferase
MTSSVASLETKPPFILRPIVLEGEVVRLEPLTLDHAPDLLEAGRDEIVWKYLNFVPPKTVDDTRRFVNDALAQAQAGARMPFAIIHRASGKAVGSTSYLDIRPADRNIEIGWTWVSYAHQRTALNTECKYLLMRHAFEDLGAIRVGLKTDSRNERSQRAIERLGAQREGVLRQHMVLWTGILRDSVYYSILDFEWPEAKKRLEGFLQQT